MFHTIALLQNQAAQTLSQWPPWILTVAFNALSAFILALLGALFRAEQKRWHAELIHMFDSHEKKIMKQVDERIIEVGDQRYVRKQEAYSAFHGD